MPGDLSSFRAGGNDETICFGTHAVDCWKDDGLGAAPVDPQTETGTYTDHLADDGGPAGPGRSRLGPDSARGNRRRMYFGADAASAVRGVAHLMGSSRGWRRRRAAPA